MGPLSAFDPVLENNIATAPVDAKAVVEAVAKLNEANAVGSENEIVVTINARRLIIQVVNRDTREVLQQISPLSIFQALRKLPPV